MIQGCYLDLGPEQVAMPFTEMENTGRRAGVQWGEDGVGVEVLSQTVNSEMLFRSSLEISSRRLRRRREAREGGKRGGLTLGHLWVFVTTRPLRLPLEDRDD